MTAAERPDRSVARLLCAHAASERSGIVRAERGKLRRLFCLENGALVFAASNVVEEQVGEFLVRKGILSPSSRATLVARAAEENRKIGDLLLRSGEVDPEALRAAAEELTRDLLSSTLEWPDGRAAFEPGVPSLAGEIVVALSPLAMIFEHCRRFPASLDALRQRLGPPDVRPTPTPDADRILAGATLDPDVRELFLRCDGATPLPALVDGRPDRERALRSIHAMMLAGALEGGRPKARIASDAPLTREECEARLAAAASNDPYSVLGITRDASPDTVRAAYYSIARRYHPDRFRSGELQDLLPRFEAFFSYVTEAHNTLSDPQQRGEYDRSSGASATATRKADASQAARQNYLRGRALAAQRKFHDALSLLERAVLEDGRRPEYRLELGLLLARNPIRRKEAEEHLLLAAELAPGLAAAYRALGELYLRAEMREAGCRLVREARKWDPDDDEAARLLGEAEASGSVPDDPGPLLRRRFGP